MRISIFKFVFFSIIICFFEYAKNELCLERSIINFRNNRVLAYGDNQFDLNDFYQSTLSLANQFNEYNDYDDDEEMEFLRNTIDSHIKKHQENNTLPDLNNVDKKTKKLIAELQAELEKVRKELDNKENNEIEIRQIQNQRITKTDKNDCVSEDANSEELENPENFPEIENNQIDLINTDQFEEDQDKKKVAKKILKRGALLVGISIMALMSGATMIPFVVLITLISVETIFKFRKLNKSKFKFKFKMPKLFK
ncbi:fam-b protein [Plasmodium yoelii]|uniref:Fam-b protein n=2 Tax=Plasmodium yoelii TaxID=5861 RepID=A0AAF0B7K4_PLAYO|nr:fam-b protein [Plasmodium yoelii]WBY59550.1 fam-b protein [Plasmodium yoelii yoelii]CDS44064.1 fam-b protein [Plasmodium yoelii]VTZ80292.1 fam-b protein [Plasmodium yoelii]|eukprot:XP_725247.2 fam-b protein [Plasmodium yoelii]